MIKLDTFGKVNIKISKEDRDVSNINDVFINIFSFSERMNNSNLITTFSFQVTNDKEKLIATSEILINISKKDGIEMTSLLAEVDKLEKIMKGKEAKMNYTYKVGTNINDDIFNPFKQTNPGIGGISWPYIQPTPKPWYSLGLKP